MFLSLDGITSISSIADLCKLLIGGAPGVPSSTPDKGHAHWLSAPPHHATQKASAACVVVNECSSELIGFS
jgi:hypothetical protein